MTSAFSLSSAWRATGLCGVIALCVFSLLPPPALMTEAPPWSDKVYHLLAYTSLMWWLAMGERMPLWRFLAGGLAVLGGVLEVLQGLTPLRMASAWDELANVSGTLCGYWLATRTPPGFPAFRRAK